MLVALIRMHTEASRIALGSRHDFCFVVLIRRPTILC